MPQMLAIQPAPPQGPPPSPSVGSPGNKEQNQFSPHLEKAITDKKQQQQNNAARDKNDNQSSPTTSKNQSADKNNPSLKPQNSEGQDTQDRKGSLAKVGAAKEADVPGDAPELTELLNPAALITSEDTLSPVIISNYTQMRQAGPAMNTLQNIVVEIKDESNSSGKTPNLTPTKPEMSPAVMEPLFPRVLQPAAGNRQDALMSQLQQLIDNSNETGTVSITKTGNSFTGIFNNISGNIPGVTATSFSGQSQPVIVNANTETSELNLNGLLLADAEGIEKSVAKPVQQSTGQRHDNQQQYFNAKLNTKNLAEDNQNPEGNKQGDGPSKQPTSAVSGIVPQSGPPGAEQTNTFAQISTITQETARQSAIESAKPILLPSGATVHEDEIIKQVTDRFQASNRHMDTRINIQLHPAELGKLKIDLTVKEGSIRANIVAQSQHSLEIIDKNIQKLKTVLESLGFEIDQITVTAESESVGDFDLFDRQLFSQNDYTPSSQKGHREDDAAFIFDESEHAARATSTGVNVKI